MAHGNRLRVSAIALVALTLLVQGCREEEQGRPLLHEKGTYVGPADTPLTEEEVEGLRARAGQAYR
jgi:hypothetical protein